MMWFSLIITVHLICGCLFVRVESQTHVTMITRNSLPPQRLVRVNGSQVNANCSNVTGSYNNICAGTSVLNDGVIPAVDTSNTAWASQLFTLDGNHRLIRLSFELESENHDRMELAVFNCPKMGIGFSSISVFFDSSFRPDRGDSTVGAFNTASQVTDTSCDHLLEICVKYNTTPPPTRFINLEIPQASSRDYVFLGEVTFLNGGNDPCYLTPRPTTERGPTTHPSTSDSGSHDMPCMAIALTIGVITAIITALLVAGISMAIHIAVYQCVYKPKLTTQTTASASKADDAIVYDVVDERVGTRTVLEMKENEAYGVAL